MSHEKSITIEVDGRFVNIPTVIEGHEVSKKRAIDAFMNKKIKSLGNRSFKTLDEAIRAAKHRSETFRQLEK